MKWTMSEPTPGSMIRVGLGTIYHFGIYISDDEVIQFGLAPSVRGLLKDSEVEVLASDIDTFLAGGFLEVAEFERKERKTHRKPKEVIAYARKKLGTRGYSILYNNCEHFAYECLTGEHISHQADDVRALFRSLAICDVYLAKLPEAEPTEPLSTPIRWEEVKAVSNATVRREKYYAWKLLGYALMRSLGKKIEELSFTRENGGRYHTEGVEFSISHQKNALAVAISRKPIGVDIEAKSTPMREAMAKRMMTDAEYAHYAPLDEDAQNEYALSLWTKKEALFKASHKEAFHPAAIETEGASVKTLTVSLDGEDYLLSVASDTPERLRLFDNITL